MWSNDEALARWTDHYESALNHPGETLSSSLNDFVFHTTDDEGIALDSQTLVEVRAAIRKLKNERAAGSDGITAELLQHSVACNAPALRDLFQKV